MFSRSIKPLASFVAHEKNPDDFVLRSESLVAAWENSEVSRIHALQHVGPSLRERAIKAEKKDDTEEEDDQPEELSSEEDDVHTPVPAIRGGTKRKPAVPAAVNAPCRRQPKRRKVDKKSAAGSKVGMKGYKADKKSEKADMKGEKEGEKSDTTTWDKKKGIESSIEAVSKLLLLNNKFQAPSPLPLSNKGSECLHCKDMHEEVGRLRLENHSLGLRLASIHGWCLGQENFPAALKQVSDPVHGGGI